MSQSIEHYLDYIPLTSETVIPYVKSISLFDEDDHVACEEIGDGNLNYVFRLSNTVNKRSLIVKQALPYAKVVGDSWPLSLDRARIESEYLQNAAKIVPQLVPKVYHQDTQMAITVMEDLKDFTILRKGLIQGTLYPNLAEHSATYMARTLFFTSDFGLNPRDKKNLYRQFCNPDLCDITEGLFFTDPYQDHQRNNFPEALRAEIEQELWADEDLQRNVAHLKLSFMTHGEALLHGDMHSGSIFVNALETRVIDPEFSYMGPIGFDVGSYLGNLLLNYLAQEARIIDPKKRQVYQAFLLDSMLQTWKYFVSTFEELFRTQSVEYFAGNPAFRHEVMLKILRDTIGFAGTELIRRTIGLAHVEDVDGIEDDALRLQVQRLAIHFGKLLIKMHPAATSIHEMLDILRSDTT